MRLSIVEDALQRLLPPKWRDACVEVHELAAGGFEIYLRRRVVIDPRDMRGMQNDRGHIFSLIADRIYELTETPKLTPSKYRKFWRRA